jgi:transglutaminase-like putative cysteine protease
VEKADDLAPVKLTIDKKENGVRFNLAVTVSGTVARIDGPGGAVELTLPEDKPVFFRLDGEILYSRGLLRPGGRMEAAVIVPDESGVAFMEARVEEQTPEGFLLKISNLIGAEKPYWYEQVDNLGRLVRFHVGSMEKRLVPEQEARLPLVPAKISNRVTAGTPPSGLYRRSEVLLRLEGEIPRGMTLVPGSAYCTVVNRGSDGFTLRLSATYPDGRLRAEPLEQKTQNEYLERAVLYEVGDPYLQEALDSSLEGARPISSDLSRVVRICRWVNRRIRTAGGVPAMASAVLAIKARRGDCTEYAAAVVGLLRQADIPARMALGLVYDGVGFQFHAWAESYVDGRWVPVDAAYKRVGLPPVYILLGYGDSETGLYENRAFRLLSGFSFRFIQDEVPPPEQDAQVAAGIME